MQGRGYNESELGHFIDHEDEAVYAEAVRIKFGICLDRVLNSDRVMI